MSASARLAEGPSGPENGEVDKIAQRHPRHRLMEESKREAELELDDHRLLAAPHRDEVGRPDLALHRIAPPLEERLHRRVEIRLTHGANLPAGGGRGKTATPLRRPLTSPGAFPIRPAKSATAQVLPMTIKVFGHKSPDTDSTGSPILWAWYLTEVRGTPAAPALLGEPNTEAAFVLKHWGVAKPEIIADVGAGEAVVIVDTNNPAELPAGHQRRRHPRRSSTTTCWSAGSRRRARSTSPCARSPAPPPSCTT